jgi:hypothetical protein
MLLLLLLLLMLMLQTCTAAAAAATTKTRRRLPSMLTLPWLLLLSFKIKFDMPKNRVDRTRRLANQAVSALIRYMITMGFCIKPTISVAVPEATSTKSQSEIIAKGSCLRI